MIESADLFVPRPALKSGHAMTLYGWGNPRYFPRLPSPTLRYFDVDAARTGACHWHNRKCEHPTIIVLHGLNASSDAHYIRGVATKAFARGMNVVRLNQRTIATCRRLSAGLFHPACCDTKHVIHELKTFDQLKGITVVVLARRESH
jgi:predicted alpha/beta-fold hydrolase